jgi:hypothetical protein
VLTDNYGVTMGNDTRKPLKPEQLLLRIFIIVSTCFLLYGLYVIDDMTNSVSINNAWGNWITCSFMVTVLSVYLWEPRK